ncbi:uncharacterized protein LOC142235379 [Haematobia irritans]|uniref:uncharacterized protein LOC142235379 n=1 Tax=Haematobia irritans TaxID=7368 RepID=UPI003F4F6379
MERKGNSFRKIGKTVGRAYSSVQRVVNNFQETGILTSKPRPGRSKILSQRVERKVINVVKVNPRVTSSKIVENVREAFKKNICAETARKVLRKAGCHGRVARRKPYVSLTNRRKRIETTAATLINNTIDQFIIITIPVSTSTMVTTIVIMGPLIAAL